MKTPPLRSTQAARSAPFLAVAAAITLGLGYGAVPARGLADNFDISPVIAVVNGVFFIASLVLVALAIAQSSASKGRRILGTALAGAGYLFAIPLFVLAQVLSTRVTLLITVVLVVGLILSGLLAAANAPGRTYAWLPLLLVPAAPATLARSAWFLFAAELITALIAAFVVIVGVRQAAMEPSRRAQREAAVAQRAATASQAQLSQQAAEIRRWEDAYALAHNGERPPAGFIPPATGVGSPVATDRTNTLAIFALVLAIIGSVVGLILGYVARSQIRRSGERGAGLALAAIIIGWVEVGLIALALVFVGIFVATTLG
jgi:hypothetical protein